MKRLKKRACASESDQPVALGRLLVSLREVGEPVFISRCVEGLAGLACRRGDYARSARLYGAAEPLREQVGAVVYLLDRVVYDRNVSTLHAQLGEAALAALWAEGRALSLDAIMEEALAAAAER